MINYTSITIKRFLAKITLDNTNCWVWIGSKYNKGYGEMRIQGKNHHAHRLSYEIFKGDIPNKFVVHHICNRHDCVNPDHLEVITNKENVLIGNGITALESRKTHCKRGHEFNIKNTHIVKTKSGQGRNCRVCMREYKKKKYQENKIKGELF